MDDKMWQTGRLKNMSEKSGLLSMTGITKYKRITSDVVEMLPYNSIASSAIYSYSCWKYNEPVWHK